MYRSIKILSLIISVCTTELFAQQQSPHFDIKPYLFQRAKRQHIDWDSTASHLKIGFGTHLNNGHSLWQLHWKWNSLHALEVSGSFESPKEDLALNYLFHFGAYAYQSTQNRIHDLWGVGGVSEQGIQTALRYCLSHRQPISLWVESGIVIPWKQFNSSDGSGTKPLFRMGVLYAPKSYVSSRKNKITRSTQDQLSVWSGCVFEPKSKQFGSQWNIAWLVSPSEWPLGQLRFGADRFESTSIFHVAFDFRVHLFPVKTPFQTTLGFGPEWHVQQSSQATSHHFGYSCSLESYLQNSGRFTPFATVQYQPSPLKYYRIGFGIRLKSSESTHSKHKWLTDYIEWLIGIPNLGAHLAISQKLHLETMLSSAWFNTTKRTHRLQALRVAGIFPELQFWGLSTSAHLRILQYDFRIHQKGEMGKGFELGVAIAKELPFLKARIQLDMGYMNLRRSSYQWIENYAVRHEQLKKSQYWGPTALRYIHFWGSHQKKAQP